MREDIAFDANGTALRGWLYLPEGATRRCPAVVMAHGFSALKEMGLDDYAEVFAAAGLACLVYDQRNFGASDGTPPLMLIATQDTITPTEIALRAFEQALAPKALQLLAGDHYYPYQAGFAASSDAARAWFVTHLCMKASPL